MRGFSLFELLIITSLLGSVSWVLIYSYSQYHEAQRLKLAANQIYSAVVATSSLAYAKRESLWLHLVPVETDRYTLIISKDSAGEETLSRVGVENITINATDHRIHFDGNQGVALGNGSFSLSSARGDTLKVIYHQLSRRVRVCSPNRASLGYVAC